MIFYGCINSKTQYSKLKIKKNWKYPSEKLFEDKTLVPSILSSFI